jgi:hypothetical protein
LIALDPQPRCAPAGDEYQDSLVVDNPNNRGILLQKASKSPNLGAISHRMTHVPELTTKSTGFSGRFMTP